MRRFRMVALVVLVSSCATTEATQQQRTRLTAKDIVKQSSPAIVRIEAGNEKIGTGFIVDKHGVIATNLHVVRGETAIKVRLLDGTQYQVLQIAGVDPGRDLALLKIQAGKDLPVLQLGDSDAMSAGDQIVAIGNPLGVFDYSVTSGLISQVRPVCDQQDFKAKSCPVELTLLQISAAISPGSSGGPMFNQFGEVVGVTTAIITAGQNINLAVPGNYLKPMVAQQSAIPLELFAKETKVDEREERPSADNNNNNNQRITRNVPEHPLSVLDGCKFDDISEVVHQIGDAIDNGAPLYNKGAHEACFRIYEGTALKLSREAPCVGVRSALGDGLSRAEKLSNYTEKAWAMRDAFDGLILVAQRWADKNPPAPQTGRHKGDAKPDKSDVKSDKVDKSDAKADDAAKPK